MYLKLFGKIKNEKIKTNLGKKVKRFSRHPQIFSKLVFMFPQLFV